MRDARDVVALAELRALRARCDDAAARARDAREQIHDTDDGAAERRARLDGVIHALAFVDRWLGDALVRAETVEGGTLEIHP